MSEESKEAVEFGLNYLKQKMDTLQVPYVHPRDNILYLDVVKQGLHPDGTNLPKDQKGKLFVALGEYYSCPNHYLIQVEMTQKWWNERMSREAYAERCWRYLLSEIWSYHCQGRFLDIEADFWIDSHAEDPREGEPTPCLIYAPLVHSSGVDWRTLFQIALVGQTLENDLKTHPWFRDLRH